MKIILQQCRNCQNPIHLDWDAWVHDNSSSPHCEPEKWEEYVRGEHNFEFEDDYVCAQPIKIWLPDDPKIVRLLKRAYEIAEKGSE